MSDATQGRSASEPPRREVSFRGAGGIALRADAWGSPDDPPVLLLHGGGQTRHAWGGTARALAVDGWYALSLDLRGHGESDWAPDGNYAFEAFAADVASVVRALDRSPVLVGASLGGLAALVAEGSSEGSLAVGLVLVDVAPSLEPRGVQRIIQFMTAHPQGFESVEQAADAIAEYLPHRPRPRDLAGLEKNLRRGDDGRLRWHWDPRFIERKAHKLPDRDVARIPDLLTRYAHSLKLPTLLVRGRRSDLLSEEGAREFLSLVPHAQFVDVSGAGHMVAGDRNDAFTDAVLRFLRESIRGLPGAGAGPPPRGEVA